MKCLSSQRGFELPEFIAKGFTRDFGRSNVLRNNCAAAARAQKIPSAMICTILPFSRWTTVDVSDNAKRESVTGQQHECAR
jgi:hypothetical protein